MLRPTTTLPVVGVIAIPFLLLTVEAATESTGVESVGTTQAPSPRKNVVAPPPLGTYPTLFPPLYLFAITLTAPVVGETSIALVKPVDVPLVPCATLVTLWVLVSTQGTLTTSLSPESS